jgi:processive 1,2-diacylglycerol beta-glucosyltransferase
MVKLFDKGDDRKLGEISDEQLSSLASCLEEESMTDRDYYINKPTLDMMIAKGVDPSVVDLLRDALGDREDMEIRWEKS